MREKLGHLPARTHRDIETHMARTYPGYVEVEPRGKITWHGLDVSMWVTSSDVARLIVTVYERDGVSIYCTGLREFYANSEFVPRPEVALISA